MNTLCSMCYVCPDEFINMVNDLIDVLRTYTAEHVLVEKFALSIQEVIASIYYSGIITNLSSDQNIKLLDICMQIGWRNIFYTSDQQVPPLSEYLINKSAFSLRDFLIQSEEKSNDNSEISNKVSQLTFPAGETGEKLIEIIDTRLKLKVKNADPSNPYFAYQHEGNIVMHQSTENAAHYFTSLKKKSQSEVLPFFARLAAFETKNEQSSILQQTLILSDLINWYSNTNLERINDKIFPLSTGKLWLLNSSLLHVATENGKIWINYRNIVGNSVMDLDIKNIQQKIQQKSGEILPILQDLESGKPVQISNNKEEDPLLYPEYLLSLLPISLYNRQNEVLNGWNPVAINKGLEQLLQNLDSTDIHNLHRIGIVYIPPNSK